MVEETDQYLYYAAQMNAHEGYDSPEAWFEANRGGIPNDVAKALKEIFDMN